LVRADPRRGKCCRSKIGVFRRCRPGVAVDLIFVLKLIDLSLGVTDEPKI
jgi:hypothetical protein